MGALGFWQPMSRALFDIKVLNNHLASTNWSINDNLQNVLPEGQLYFQKVILVSCCYLLSKTFCIVTELFIFQYVALVWYMFTHLYFLNRGQSSFLGISVQEKQFFIEILKTSKNVTEFCLYIIQIRNP